MQTIRNAFAAASTPSSAARPVPAPTPLSAEQLKLVAGGMLPKGGWSTELPKGGW